MFIRYQDWLMFDFNINLSYVKPGYVHIYIFLLLNRWNKSLAANLTQNQAVLLASSSISIPVLSSANNFTMVYDYSQVNYEQMPLLF